MNRDEQARFLMFTKVYRVVRAVMPVKAPGLTTVSDELSIILHAIRCYNLKSDKHQTAATKR